MVSEAQRIRRATARYQDFLARAELLRSMADILAMGPLRNGWSRAEQEVEEWDLRWSAHVCEREAAAPVVLG